MKKIIKRVLISFIFLCVSFPIFADVVLTDSEYAALLKRLKSDKVLLAMENIRWKKLAKSKPKITYEILDDKVVIQTVEIPIHNSKPLIYEVKFVVEKKKPAKWVPWTFQLMGIVETTYKMGDTFDVYPDFKIGVRFFSTLPSGIKFLNIGFNLFIGIRSSGGSISYSLPKPLKNTSIHVYFGVTYEAKFSYGFGISLNF